MNANRIWKLLPALVVALLVCLPASAAEQVRRGYKAPAPRKPPPPPSSVKELDVPLTVREVAGVERKREVCSTGVPLPCGLLGEPEGLAVYDPRGRPVPAQFRVLERWCERGPGKDDDSVKWVLVTFDAASNRSAMSNMARVEVR